MFGAEVGRIVRRFMVLSVLAAGLFAFAGEGRGSTPSCCTNCNNNYIACVNGCGGDAACHEACGDAFDVCEDRCWRLQHQLC